MMGIGNSETTNTTLQEVKYIPSKNSEKFENECSGNKPDTLFLYFTVLIGGLPIVVGGASIAFPSSAVVKLLSNDTKINPIENPITTFEISLMLGAPALIGIFGSSLFAKLSDVTGRKVSYQILALGMFLSITALAFSKRIDLIIAFISCWVFFFSGAMGLFPIYISDICEDNNRAKFGCLITAFATIGQLFSFILGSALSYRTFTFLIAFPLIPFFILFFWAPDSPVFLLSKGRKQDCLRAIRKLRSNKNEKELEHDLNILNKIVLSQILNSTSVFSIFNTKERRIGMFLAMFPMTIQIFSGIPVVLSLLAPIVDETNTKLSGTTVAIMVGVAKVSCFLFVSTIVEKVGRKKLLFFSCIGACLPITSLGLFFYLKHINSPIVPQIQWLPVISILAYFISYSFGIGPIPVSLISEFFLPDIKATATPIVASYSILLASVLFFGYPLLSEMIGIYSCLWIFGINCLFSAIGVYFMLPETKGKSILQIQDILKNY